MTKKPHPSKPWAALARVGARLKADRRGGVLMVMGLAIVPLTFALGFGIDYSRAMRLQTHLNAAADAAALAAVAPAMILESDDTARSAAESMFDAQAAMLSGYRNPQRTAVIADGTSGSSGSLGYLRKATVSYTAQSINIFGRILGADTLTVRGTSAASAEQPPNVDFYLAMDNSPSMLLPATSAGITMVQNVTGCAFACHEYLPRNEPVVVRDGNKRRVLLSSSYYTSGSSNKNVYYLYDDSTKTLYDSSGNALNPPPTTSTSSTTSGRNGNGSNTTTTTTTVTYSIPDPTLPTKDSGPTVITKTTKITTSGSSKASTSSSTYDTGYWADGYWLTHNYGLLYGSPSSIVLRKDDVVSAASQLIPFAADQAQQYHVTYQAQMFSFDWTRKGSTSPVKTLNSLVNVSSYGSGFSAAALFPADDEWWQNSAPTSSTNINDQATEMTNMLTTMNGIIPTAGTGAAGSTPQKILFIVTDGMLDQPGSSRYYGPLRSSDLTYCTAIKAKGIKIAVLYTQYLPEALSGDDFSQKYVAPFLPAPPAPYPAGNAGSSDQILTALQQCASPGTNGSPLVQTVTANGSIITALQQLFSTALQSSRLVQ